MTAKAGVGMTTSATSADTSLVIRFKDVVLVVLDRLGGEEVGELVAARVLVGPLLDSGVHVTLDLNIVASSSRVVKCADHIVDDFVNGNRRVLPSIENSTSAGQ